MASLETSSSSSEENLSIAGCCEDTGTSKETDEPLAGPSQESGASGTGDGMDRLFSQHKNEIMFELRRLKMGDRPVTGQGHREAVADFFHNMYDPDSRTQSRVTEQHRPEAVLVEVQGLVESRPVSSLLQSLQFRRQLEGALRSSIQTVRARHAPAAGVQQRQRNTASDGASTSQATSMSTSPAPAAAAASFPDEPPTPTDRAASWLLEHVPAEPAGGRPVGEVIQELQRDNILGDISELLHQQLVTHTLESPFRHTLETRILSERLSQMDSDGRRVQEFVRSLPRGQVIRNDFSHLGFPESMPLAADSLSDSVSVISATAAVHVAQHQTNAVVNREIAALKSQLQELQSMMRLSFDLQLDIQRSIKQEVAASLASVTGGATGAPAGCSKPVDDSHCLICLDRTADSVMYQCGHLCVCYPCGMILKSRGHNCPVCRAPIKDILRVYRSN